MVQISRHDMFFNVVVESLEVVVILKVGRVIRASHTSKEVQNIRPTCVCTRSLSAKFLDVSILSFVLLPSLRL